MNRNLTLKDAAPCINITPLIDVLLVLLIIFMVVSPLKPSRFETKIPSEPQVSQAVNPHPDALVVTIEKDLRLKLNKNEIGPANEPEQLIAELQRIFHERLKNNVFREDTIGRTDLSDEEKTEKTVFIKAPRRIAYGEIVKVIDAIKGAGAEPIGLQIDDLSQ